MIDRTVITLTFWVLTVLCCGYASVFGKRDGVLASGMIMAGVLLSAGAELLQRNWGSTNLPVMAVDGMLLLGLGALSARSRSFWPMWMTAAQLLSVVTHVASLLSSGFSQRVYAGLESVWAIPCLGSMVVGITLDRRRRLATGS